MRRAAPLAFTALLAAACARPRPDAFVTASARAARAAHAGRHAEAAAGWSEAAAEADQTRDESDARLRAADATLRAGDRDRALAMYDALGRDVAHPPIAARARLEASLLRLARGAPGDAEAARSALRALVFDAPQTGAGRRALDHVLRLFDEAGDDLGARAWLREAMGDSRVRGTDLDPAVTHLLARRLARAGERPEAVRLWRDLFSRRGFGHNPRWDDGHLALAQSLLDGGDARGAVEAIDAMFAPWGSSWFVGSYTGPRMPEAAMLRARVYRDRLADPGRAEEAFRFVWERLEHSTLRDDAMAECAAMLEAVDAARACALWARLYAELPCSPRARRGGARPRCGLAEARCERGAAR